MRLTWLECDRSRRSRAGAGRSPPAGPSRSRGRGTGGAGAAGRSPGPPGDPGMYRRSPAWQSRSIAGQNGSGAGSRIVTRRRWTDSGVSGCQASRLGDGKPKRSRTSSSGRFATSSRIGEAAFSSRRSSLAAGRRRAVPLALRDLGDERLGTVPQLRGPGTREPSRRAGSAAQAHRLQRGRRRLALGISRRAELPTSSPASRSRPPDPGGAPTPSRAPSYPCPPLARAHRSAVPGRRSDTLHHTATVGRTETSDAELRDAE